MTHLDILILDHWWGRDPSESEKQWNKSEMRSWICVPLRLFSFKCSWLKHCSFCASYFLQKCSVFFMFCEAIRKLGPNFFLHVQEQTWPADLFQQEIYVWTMKAKPRRTVKPGYVSGSVCERGITLVGWGGGMCNLCPGQVQAGSVQSKLQPRGCWPLSDSPGCDPKRLHGSAVTCCRLSFQNSPEPQQI